MRQNLGKKRLLELTLAVYKVTAIFPIGEEEQGLGSKIRELADKILVGKGSVEEMTGLLDAAEAKNWVDARNFSVLRREYENIRQICALSESAQVVHSPRVHRDENQNRQYKIIEAINGNGTIKIGELIRLFPGINRRTVLRDLDKLCQAGIMNRNGNGRGAYYAKNGLKCDIPQEMSQ